DAGGIAERRRRSDRELTISGREAPEIVILRRSSEAKKAKDPPASSRPLIQSCCRRQRSRRMFARLFVVASFRFFLHLLHVRSQILGRAKSLFVSGRRVDILVDAIG